MEAPRLGDVNYSSTEIKEVDWLRLQVELDGWTFQMRN
jgi:hypothetical protein